MDYHLSKLELLLLAAERTDLLDFLAARSDPLQGRDWHCPNCGPINYDLVKQAERDETCVYVCRQCGQIVDEELPF